MANELDEVSGPINAEGRDVNVISKQIPVQIGTGSLVAPEKPEESSIHAGYRTI